MKKTLLKYSFQIVIGVSLILAATVGGFVRDGMFMGLVSTMALWFLIVKLPKWVKELMGRYILLTDFILTVLLFSMFSVVIGPGPTAFMCTVTQAVVLSVLLRGLSFLHPYQGPRVATCHAATVAY